jgi:excisionase family DNA binding protein
MSTSSFDIPEKRLFRMDEVAKILGVSRFTVYRWCDHGKIDFVRIGPRMMRIERECVVKFIKVSGDNE